jgi:hypothetical protein
MFHETCLAPFRQIRKLRSPDVARFPFVGGSTQAVMTPLWMPGFSLLPAEATEATPMHESTTAAPNSHLFPADFTISNPLFSACGQDVPYEDVFWRTSD